MTGEVKSYNPRTGYGFITSEGVDYFAHFSQWQERVPFTKGLVVEFTPKETPKGIAATAIRIGGEHG